MKIGTYLWPFMLLMIGGIGLENETNVSVEKSVYAEAFKSEQYKFPDMSFDLNKFYIGLKIDSFVKSKNINGNIIVARDGKIIYKRSEGYANFGDYKPLNFQSTFQLASTSKPFTAVSIMQLVEKSKINLDDTIQKYIPEFPYKNITVRMLLCHRSGLPDYTKFAGVYVNEEEYFDNEKLIAVMADKRPKIYAFPNTVFDYCNTNFAVLTSIVERVSGLAFEDYLKKNIFDPLDMKSSYGYRKGKTPWKANQTAGYESNGKLRPTDFLDGVLGDKGIYSTADDLLKFDQSFYSKKILTTASIKEMQTAQTWESQSKGYGLGYRILTMSDYSKGVYHNGWWKGYSNAFFRIPEKGITVIILCNKFNSSVYKCAQPIVSILTNTPPLPENNELGGSE
ncbi:MAG: beta-lactamase family protein [Bacteroidetes bacterium]|nr:beta-lactamase family protein [Bacteroidota bacterium]MBK8673017.1 beta-lactamase family protein [Bacteroidota bacterium]MBP7256407.1 beta-lactamase family protein [Chitinophagales bacterium]